MEDFIWRLTSYLLKYQASVKYKASICSGLGATGTLQPGTQLLADILAWSLNSSSLYIIISANPLK